VPIGSRQVRVTYVHPSDPATSITATVNSRLTSTQQIHALIRISFMYGLTGEAYYKLLDTATQRELGDYESLADAGIAQARTLLVVPHVNGA
jgi:hypothetical protein